MQWCSALVITLAFQSISGTEAGRRVDRRSTGVTVFYPRRRGRFHHKHDLVLAMYRRHSRFAHHYPIDNTRRGIRLSQEETVFLCG